jgi:hypothetical protein
MPRPHHSSRFDYPNHYLLHPTKFLNINVFHLRHVFNRNKQNGHASTSLQHACLPVRPVTNTLTICFEFPCIIFNRQSKETMGKTFCCYVPKIDQMKVTLFDNKSCFNKDEQQLYYILIS